MDGIFFRLGIGYANNYLLYAFESPEIIYLNLFHWSKYLDVSNDLCFLFQVCTNEKNIRSVSAEVVSNLAEGRIQCESVVAARFMELQDCMRL